MTANEIVTLEDWISTIFPLIATMFSTFDNFLSLLIELEILGLPLIVYVLSIGLFLFFLNELKKSVM